MSNIEEKFENLASRLAVPIEIQKQCKGLIKSFFNELNIEYGFFYPFPNSVFRNYWIGGSFDRHTYISEKFDIDLYLIFQNPYSFGFIENYRIVPESLGINLLEQLLRKLQFLETRGKIKILRQPPYRHAIPIKLSGNISVDCIPAL